MSKDQVVLRKANEGKGSDKPIETPESDVQVCMVFGTPDFSNPRCIKCISVNPQLFLTCQTKAQDMLKAQLSAANVKAAKAEKSGKQTLTDWLKSRLIEAHVSGIPVKYSELIETAEGKFCDSDKHKPHMTAISISAMLRNHAGSVKAKKGESGDFKCTFHASKGYTGSFPNTPAFGSEPKVEEPKPEEKKE